MGWDTWHSQQYPSPGKGYSRTDPGLLQGEERTHMSHVLSTLTPPGPQPAQCPTVAVAAPGHLDFCPTPDSRSYPGQFVCLELPGF